MNEAMDKLYIRLTNKGAYQMPRFPDRSHYTVAAMDGTLIAVVCGPVTASLVLDTVLGEDNGLIEEIKEFTL